MKKSKNNILWIGGISWLRTDNTYFPEVTYPGIVSGSAFQQAIIEGIELQGDNVRILSDCDMSTGDRIEWSHNHRSKDVRVAGNGNKLLRIVKKIKELLFEIKKRDILKGINVVCAYEMHLPYLFSLYFIKILNKSIKTVLICPDLNIYMDLNTKHKSLKSYLKKIENYVAKKLLRNVDGYVLFTEQMCDYFSSYDKPYIVIEGVYRDKYSLKKVGTRGKYIMHAGSLHNNTGIEELIEAFEDLKNDDVELLFFGSGAMDNYILEKAKNNNKIKHMGFINPEKLFEYEKNALVLVNIRNPKEEYTKYSFPSKTFEYMASGTPCLFTDLLGIPNEYKNFVIIIKNNSKEEVKKGLNKIISMSDADRESLGLNARNFILKNKNKVIQSKKIIDFISSL